MSANPLEDFRSTLATTDATTLWRLLDQELVHLERLERAGGFFAGVASRKQEQASAVANEIERRYQTP